MGPNFRLGTAAQLSNLLVREAVIFPVAQEVLGELFTILNSCCDLVDQRYLIQKPRVYARSGI